MDSNGQNGTPDIASILASLSQYTQQNANQPQPTQQRTGHNGLTQSFDQPTVSASAPLEKTTDPRLNRPQGRNTPQQRSSTASPRPVIDPATIISWPEALRCVTKIAAHNQNFATSIRRMITDQKRNEMRWYSERQALKQNQTARAASAAKALSLLAGINGEHNASFDEQVEEVDKEAELREFDSKIYAAQLSMEYAMTMELKGLGVPFFGTSGEFVVPDGGERKGVLEPGKITEKELVGLRRRMVGYLEDMYRD